MSYESDLLVWLPRLTRYALSGRGDDPRLREIAMKACSALGGPPDAWKG